MEFLRGGLILVLESVLLEWMLTGSLAPEETFKAGQVLEDAIFQIP